MKVDSKIFKGIEYIQVSELPQAQRELVNQSILPDQFIKLLIDGKIISGCLQYKDYHRWYDEFFLQHLKNASEQVVVSEIEVR